MFPPPYSYEALPVSDVPTVVNASAGNNSGGNDTDAATGSASITGPTSPVTPGAGFTLTAVPAGFTPATYQWRRNNIAIPGATAATFSVNAAMGADAATYTVAIGLSSDDVIVSSPLAISLNAIPIAPEDAQLKVNGGGAPSFWLLTALATICLLHRSKLPASTGLRS